MRPGNCCCAWRKADETLTFLGEADCCESCPSQIYEYIGLKKIGFTICKDINYVSLVNQILDNFTPLV